MASDVQVGFAGFFEERDYQLSRTMAVVDLRPVDRSANELGSEGSARMFDLALRKIEQVVRGDDRVCPFGISRVAIAFGPDANAVTPKTLGERLARAVRQNPVSGGPADLRSSSNGAMNERRGPTSDEDDEVLRALGTIPSSTTVTVDRLLGGASPQSGRIVGSLELQGRSQALLRQSMPIPRIRRRTVVRYSTGPFAKYGTRHDDQSIVGNGGTILVVSPARTSGGTPGLSSVAASAVAQRLGFDVDAVALTCDDELILDIHGVGLDLVVLVVEGEREPANELASWSSSTWNIPAQLAGEYFSEGIGVLAVGAGAGAGALAGCAAQGATVLFDLGQLQAELSQLRAGPGADNSWDAPSYSPRIPPSLETLVQLTASERRVLFYLTTGRSAQEIADDLVVSVTTVRSHIRSILRKLGVRSQLAAVAIANSQDIGRTQITGSAQEIQRDTVAPGVP